MTIWFHFDPGADQPSVIELWRVPGANDLSAYTGPDGDNLMDAGDTPLIIADAVPGYPVHAAKHPPLCDALSAKGESHHFFLRAKSATGLYSVFRHAGKIDLAGADAALVLGDGTVTAALLSAPVTARLLPNGAPLAIADGGTGAVSAAAARAALRVENLNGVAAISSAVPTPTELRDKINEIISRQTIT